jgi:hypothetical protein
LVPVSELYEFFVTEIPYVENNDLYRQIGGVALAVMALLAFLPIVPKRRKGREVSFHGTHGDVTIELQHVEDTLEAVVAKLPDVKSISLSLKPQETPGQVKVLAVAVLKKDADTDARLITARVNSFIRTHTQKILGVQDVQVKLKVKRFLMRMRTVKPEPLLLEAPDIAADSYVQDGASAPQAGQPQSSTAFVRASTVVDGEEDPTVAEIAWPQDDEKNPESGKHTSGGW